MPPSSLVFRVASESRTGLSNWNALSLMIFTSKRWAGHSHWQNVRSTKEAHAREKAQATNHYIKAVSSAIKNGGGIRDPKLNHHLASVLAAAKANSVPFSTLERVLKEPAADTPFLFEVIAPGGLFILVEGMARSVSYDRHWLTSIIRRFGCSISPSTGKIASDFFSHVGLLSVPAQNNQKIPDFDSAVNLAIEIGADEVVEASSDGTAVFQFHCDPRVMDSLKQKLEQEYNVVVSSAEDVYIPKKLVTVSPSVYENLKEMYGRIRQHHEHVHRIFDNVTVQQDTQ